MELLNHIPLVGVILGFFLLLLVLTNKSGQFKNRKTKYLLAAIIFLNTHLQLDSFLYFTDNYRISLFGYSFFFYHLNGLLFYLYTLVLFKNEIKLRWWGFLIIVYTLARTYPISYDLSNEDYAEPLNMVEIISILDYYISILLNLTFLLVAYIQIKKINFAVELTRVEQNHYKWIKGLLIVTLLIYLATFQSSILLFLQESEWLTYMKVETLIQSFFFFAVVYFAIRFPVFSIHGDYYDLDQSKSKKYAKSSLSEEGSNELWERINQVIVTEKLYTNPEYRLNDLAEKVECSLHHVSQVINEKQGTSYSDYINSFRIKEAQRLLVSPEYDSFTILAIAYEVGFNSKTAFYNAFKKQTGQTPSQYKKNI